MSTDVRIQDFRLSLISFETITDIFGGSIDGRIAAPFDRLGSKWKYVAKFEEAIRKGGLDLDTPGPHWRLEPPWPKFGDDTQRFWIFYALKGQKPLSRITGNQAWKALVPFRIRVPVRVEAPW